MIIIDKKNLERYRYAVAKMLFLKLYENFTLVQNMGGNCMLVTEESTQNTIVLSILGQPNPQIKTSHQIYCYYQKKSLGKASGIGTSKVFILSDDFDSAFEEDIINTLLNPSASFSSLNYKYQSLFSGILIDTNSIKNNEIIYKHYSLRTISENKHDVNLGNISFSNPHTFNDPFDCNCMFADSSDMSRFFRIFCVATEFSNIPMWAYYSTDHKGYCFGYNKRDVIASLLEEPLGGLCIIGKVKYEDDRPAQKSVKRKLSFSELQFYINAAFIKYKNWEHEKEYRFVILSKDPHVTSGDYFNRKIDVCQVYEGCEGDGRIISDLAKKSIPITKLHKDAVDYKLV